MKAWFSKNIIKIALAISTIGAVSGVTGLALGIVNTHKTDGLTYFLDYNHIAIWGDETIWAYSTGDKHQISLYFSKNKHNDSHIKWNGIYPDGYFND